jgi:hypothetical protein
VAPYYPPHVFSTSNAMAQSTFECGNSRSGDLYVMILGIRADADRADYSMEWPPLEIRRRPSLHRHIARMIGHALRYCKIRECCPET